MIRSILGAVVALLAAAAPAGAADGRYVLAVNAGSNSVSSLAVDADGLELRDVEASGGIRPTSVAERNGLVYVLNPSQIAIAPDSDALVVTERATNSIMTWELDGDGRAPCRTASTAPRCRRSRRSSRACARLRAGPSLRRTAASRT